MRSIIQEFYLGGLTPSAARMRPSSEMAEATAVLAEMELRLRAGLEGERLDMLARLVSAQTDLTAATALENYVNGFRCGARFMLDILCGEGENTLPLA